MDQSTAAFYHSREQSRRLVGIEPATSSSSEWPNSHCNFYHDHHDAIPYYLFLLRLLSPFVINGHSKD